MSRRTATVIGAAVLGAAMLFGVAALQAQQAQKPQEPAPVTFTVAGTALAVSANSSGWVHVAARRGTNRVAGWYAPAAIEAWAADAERVISGQAPDAAPIVRKASNAPGGERVEFKTRLLLSADTGGVALDRVEQDVGVTHGLFLSDKGSMHRIYIPLDASNAHAFVEALRGAAASSRQLAAAVKAAPMVAEKTRSGGME